MSPSTTPGTWRMLRSILDLPTKIRLILAAVTAGVLALFESAAIVTVLPVVDIAVGAPYQEGAVGRLWTLLGEPSREQFGLILAGIVVALFVVKDVLSIAFTWWQMTFVARERVALSVRIFRTVMQLPYVQFRRRSSGEIFRTMTEAVRQTFASLVNGLISMVSAGLTVLAIVITLLIIVPAQSLLLLGLFALAALAYGRIVRPRLSRAGESMMSGWVELTNAGFQGLNGFKETKVRDSAEHVIDRFRAGVTATETASRDGNFFSGITKYFLEILFILGVGTLLAVTFTTGSAQAAIGSLALFVAAGFRVLPAVSMLIGSVNGFRTGRPSLEIVFAELSDSVRGTTVHDVAEPLPFTSELVLDGVRFAYPGAEDEVLRGVDLRIRAGTSVAFVGGSGAGKTTLIDTVVGLLSPTQGRILVDGVDTTGRERSWQKNVSMVAQEVFVTEDSILENILFDTSPETADPTRLAAAIDRAQLRDLIDSMPEGLDSSAGEWGSLLSGGQRQRIGIARALYTNPSLLVLDEATSALDNETERRITDTIAALRGRVTVLVVAHRLSTVRHVDEVVFLQNGRVAGRGTFEKLQATNPDFAHLVRLGDLGGQP